MGYIGEDPHEVEFEPLEAPSTAEPITAPSVPEEVPAGV